MIHKFLFYIQNGKIKTYHVRDGKFELMRYKGNDFFTDDIHTFWAWWEKISSFIQDEHEVNFCFLTNEEGFVFNQNYPTVVTNTWSITELESFIFEYLPHLKVTLKENYACQVLSSNRRATSMFSKEETEIALYVKVVPNTSLLATQHTLKNCTDTNNKSVENESVLYAYYLEKTKSYN